MNVQKKFLLVISIFIAIFSVSLSYIFQFSTNKALKDDFFEKGKLLSKNLAYNSKLGLVLGDHDNLMELINGVMQQSEVQYALLYDLKGKIVATSGDSIPGENLLMANQQNSQPMVHSVTKSLVEFIVPVYLEKSIKGYALLGLSLSSLNQKIFQANIKAIVVTLFFVLIAILSIKLITRFILRDLGSIKQFAVRLAEGHHGEHIQLNRKDEIGDLAQSLNAMSDHIKKTLAQSEENFHKARETAKIIESNHQNAILEKQQLETWVGEILHILDKIKAGDLTEPVVSKMQGEIARVAAGINLMISEFSQVLSQLRSASNAVSKASTNIIDIGSQIAVRADNQFQNTDSMAAAIEEMAATLENANKSMEQASEIAVRAHHAAIDGGSIVQKAIEGINRIASVVENSAKTVQSLGTQSKQISEIIEVIDEIADQTNLLALNAAIEAARAGEQGRGFAVVADEVRKLAERTSNATGEIAGVIQKILNLTMKAVKAMEKGNTEMQNGKELVEKVGNALGQIVDAVDAMQMEFERIVETSREQAIAATQISDRIGVVRNLAKENAENAANVKNAGLELDGQIQGLSNLVNRFKIGDPKAIMAVSQADPAPSTVANVQKEVSNQIQPEASYAGPERREGHEPEEKAKIHPEGRRASDKGKLAVGPNGNIQPIK